jgi:hypothetical protein
VYHVLSNLSAFVTALDSFCSFEVLPASFPTALTHESTDRSDVRRDYLSMAVLVSFDA